jgi:hypothetical protein
MVAKMASERDYHDPKDICNIAHKHNQAIGQMSRGYRYLESINQDTFDLAAKHYLNVAIEKVKLAIECAKEERVPPFSKTPRAIKARAANAAKKKA